ncbi:ureidoglycolate lyase [Pusillimonas sp. SM2304]|uniref:ureidoglycolate lyase n=1 Tax=Pusillimonas sp. SM2304 TaxID=3073241 RepID=UPI0028751F4F|nr:ureidoglycolate lyase [Pusillimonas sp. SM2304]MDS1141015.1 ureidoglycolate lyase [Pusillimonas sp. SM2304]
MPLIPLAVETLTPEAFAAYGSVWGRPYGTDTPAFSNAATDFWHQHHFDAGDSGQPEILWVNYRKNDRCVDTLEVHWLTEQAIVPLGPEGLFHIVALGGRPGEGPDPATLKAFYIPAGQGICMRPGCWHASQVRNAQVSCLMLTRASTTAELVGHLACNRPATESKLAPLGNTYVLREPGSSP